MTTTLWTAIPADYLDPGPLFEPAGELELIPASESWLDALLAAQDDPLTREFMPAAAGIPREKHLEFLAKLVEGFDPGDPDVGRSPAHHFWMRRRNAGRQPGALPLVGAIALRVGHAPDLERIAGHVGYHVYPFARGQRYAERACRLLLPLARRHALSPLWITCNPDNLPSRRTCERLGGTLVETVPIPDTHALYARGEREKCRYRIEL